MQQPQYIGRYRIVDRLGRGGMGTVLRAVDDSLKREVAIKLPNDSDPDDIKRLQQECDVLMQLQHHNIVQVYGSGNEVNLPFYIVMEYVDGVTIEQLLRQQGGRLEPHRALQIALAVAEALSYAHRPPLRVIHRDIKPSNVLIRNDDGAVKVTDFGIAAVLAERSGRSAIGTLSYMAPEQAMGKGVDERSDLYSLGAILYEMLTSQRPPQLASAPAQPPSLLLGSMLPPEMSARIDRLLLGVLRSDRDQRVPQSVAEVVEELRALLEGRPAHPLGGREANAASIANMPTLRASMPPSSTEYTPPLSGPAGSGPWPAGGSYTPPPGYQLVPAAPASYTPPPGYQLVPVAPAGIPTAYTPPSGYQLVPIAPAAYIPPPGYQIVPIASKPRMSRKATASLWLGIIGLSINLIPIYGSVLGLILAIIGLILGRAARKDIKESNGQLAGERRAIIGIRLGKITLVLILLAGVVIGIIGIAALATNGFTR